MDPKLQQAIDDPIIRMVNKETDGKEELSPMSPPSVFSLPSRDGVSKQEMHPYLQKLMDEHDVLVEQLSIFEGVLEKIPQEGITKDVDNKLREFFRFFDEEFMTHQRKEEKELFPILSLKLPKVETHIGDSHACTPVEIMEADHIKILQLAAVVFNFFGLCSRMPDPKSRLLILDAAIAQGKSFIELLRLHMFREDQVVFALAHKHIEKDLFDQMKTNP